MNSGHKVALFKYPRWPKKRMPLSHRSIIAALTPLSLTDKGESVYSLSRFNCINKKKKKKYINETFTFILYK